LADKAIDPLTIKHLEFIHGVVGRLANDSFLMKGWALTVGGAFFGFSVRDLNWRIALVGLLPVMAFWGLDSYFLSRERMFRALYDAVRTGDPTVEPMCMDYRLCAGPNLTWRATLPSPTLWLFYGPILAVGIVAIVAGACHWGA
jgi:hypothetical protein